MTEEQPLQEQGSIPAEAAFIKKRKPAISYFGQLGILLGLTGAGLVAGSLVGIIVWVVMTGGSPMEFARDMMKPGFANAAKTMQLVASFFMFFMPAFFYALMVNRNPLKHLGYQTTFSSKQVLLVIIMAGTGIILSGALDELNKLIPISKNLAARFKVMEDQYSEQVMIMAQMKNIKDYLFTLVVIALAPAMFEETLFRGGLQQLLVNWTKNAWIGIIITSLLFSAVHGSYYGFLPRAGLGVILGLIFYYSKNIWLNILLHFINNAIGVTALYTASKEGKFSKEVLNDTTYPLYVSFFALIVLLALFKIFKKECDALGVTSINNTYSPDNPFD